MRCGVECEAAAREILWGEVSADCFAASEGEMTPTEWTKEKPTAPGYYWLKVPSRHSDRGVRHFANVYWGHDEDNNSCLCVGTDRGHGYVEHLDGEWAGPLPAPPEP